MLNIRFMNASFYEIFVSASEVLGLIAVPMFCLFVGHSLLIGGDALNGAKLDGRYFVYRRGGKLREVKKLSFLVSRVLGWIGFGGIIQAVLVGIFSGILEG